jgi:hypothetical protein
LRIDRDARPDEAGQGRLAQHSPAKGVGRPTTVWGKLNGHALPVGQDLAPGVRHRRQFRQTRTLACVGRVFRPDRVGQPGHEVEAGEDELAQDVPAGPMAETMTTQAPRGLGLPIPELGRPPAEVGVLDHLLGAALGGRERGQEQRRGGLSRAPGRAGQVLALADEAQRIGALSKLDIFIWRKPDE